MQTTLPVVAPPAVYGFQFYAFPLAIVGTIPGSDDWVLSNFIQLAFDRSPGSPVPMCFYLYDYAENPWLETMRITPEWLSMVHPEEHIIKFIRTQLSQGFYVYLNVDEFYIEDREMHEQEHHSHDILVHGIDDREGTLNVLGYDSKFQFRSTKVRQNSFARAYKSHRAMDADCQQLYCYRPRREVDYPLDRSLIRRSLIEYLKGDNTSKHFAMLRRPWERDYGLRVYDGLQATLEAFIAGDTPGDLRSLYVLWEHKRLMSRRLRRISSGEEALELICEAEALERWASALRMGMLRYQMHPSGSRFRQAVESLPELREADAAFVSRLIALPELH